MFTFGRNAENFARVLNATTAEYVREEMNNILRERILFAELTDRRRIHRQPGGDSKIWSVKYKLDDLQTLADMEPLTFQRFNRRHQAIVYPRGYAWTDQMSLWERWQNQSQQAIIRLHDGIVKDGMEDFRDNLGDKFYKDGYAAGSQDINGLESWYGISGSVTGNTKIGNPSDTYATIPTNLGIKGTWGSTAWPGGTGKPGYHYWAPLVGFYDEDWGNSSTLFKDNVLTMLKYLNAHQLKRRQRVQMWLFSTDAYLDTSNKVEQRETIRVVKGESVKEFKGGYGPELMYEGVRITSEYGVPELDSVNTTKAVKGYGLNFDKIEICHWSPEFIYPLPVDFSIERLANRYAIVNMSQQVTNPQAQSKIRES